MKVAHINTEKTFRGGERQVIFLIEGLREKEVTNYLVCNKNAKIKERALKFIPETNILELNISGEFDPFAIVKIRNFLKKHKIDIVHCHTSHAHTVGYFATLGLDTKVLVSRRVDFSIHRKGIRFLSSIKYNKLCDKIISISETIKEILINDGVKGDKIITVHSGVELLPFLTKSEYNYLFKEFNIPENYIKIVNVAALEEHKGQYYLLHSFANLLKKYENIILIIVGDGKLRDSLAKLANNLGISHNVVFTGFRTDVVSFLNLSDIFVMSSLDEGLCTSILDALTLNKVVVATNAGGIPEIIKHESTGLLTEKGNIESFTNGLYKALDKLDFYKKKFSNTREYINKNFSVEQMVEGNYKVYRDILK